MFDFLSDLDISPNLFAEPKRNADNQSNKNFVFLAKDIDNL